jgi:pimeloyl-ACP methyl ester carboxylesterase
MVSKTIYVNEEGKKRLENYYEEYLGSMQVSFEREYVDTRFGATHVLVTGPEDGKPLFILQGGNCINPMTLAWFGSLLKKYRVYSPDTIGHPGFSAETRLSGKDDSYALWLSDIMKHYQLEKAAFAGSSFGGGVILRLATFMPEKISCAILFAPAGLILGSKLKMIRDILIPLLLFKRNRSEKQLKRISDVMSDGKMKDDDAKIIGEIFQSVKLERDMPKLTTGEELRDFTAPTMIIAGEKDVFFPGQALLKKAKKIIPGLKSSHLYPIGHFSAEEELIQINQEMSSFLEKYYR